MKYRISRRSQYDTLQEKRDAEDEVWYCGKLNKNVRISPDQWPEEWKGGPTFPPTFTVIVK